MSRSADAARLAELVGPDLQLEEGDGWPMLARLRIERGHIPVAIYIGPIGLSHRNRDDIERRFQNPGGQRPIDIPDDRTPLLLGLWDDDPRVDVAHPVVVVADARRREGRVTRYSVFVPLATLDAAGRSGWAEAVNHAGEHLVCFDPKMLPVVAMALANDVEIPVQEGAIAVEAAGVAESISADDRDAAVGRARRASTAVVRSSRFARDVRDAYDGRCAMCGLGIGVVQAAHVHPASAPGSVDEIPNGICLCANHHLAFDRFLVWVDPESRELRLAPEVTNAVIGDAAAAHFVESTRPILAEPIYPDLRPSVDAFERRYRYFSEQYGWVDDIRGH